MKRKAVLLTLFLIVFLDLLGLGIAIPILAPLLLNPESGVLAVSFDESTRTMILGFLLASFPIAQFFGAPILGSLSDKYGRKPLLLISIAGTLVGYIIFATGIVLGDIYLLFIGRALDGFTGGNISVVNSAIADISDQKSRAKNFGLIGMAFGIGFIIGPFIGGKLADPALVSWFNFDTPFWFAAILASINIIFVLLFVKETLKTKREAKISLLTGIRDLGKAFKLSHLRTIFIVIFLLNFGFTFFTQFFQVFLIQKFSFDQSQIGDLFAYIGIWIALTQGILIRPVSKRFTPRQVLRISPLFLSITLFIILLPTQPIYLLITQPLVAIAHGLTAPNYIALVSNTSKPEEQGEILGMTQSIQSFAHAIPPIVAGFIVTFNMNLPILVASGVTLAAWAFFIIFFKKHKPQTISE